MRLSSCETVSCTATRARGRSMHLWGLGSQAMPYLNRALTGAWSGGGNFGTSLASMRYMKALSGKETFVLNGDHKTLKQID